MSEHKAEIASVAVGVTVFAVCEAGAVAFTERMNPSGSPRSRSYAAKASKGLDRITPPKSNSTARIVTAEIVGGRRDPVTRAQHGDDAGWSRVRPPSAA